MAFECSYYLEPVDTRDLPQRFLQAFGVILAHSNYAPVLEEHDWNEEEGGLRVEGETEHAASISQNVADPDEWRHADLFVFGAGDVACEAAIALADRGNRVTMTKQAADE